MDIPEPKAGLVIQYSYLWCDEAARGQEEGVKDRPCVITHLTRKDDRTFAYVAPITHSPQPPGAGAVEVPALTRQRLGLDDAPCWVVAREVNRFEWPGYDLRPVPHDKSRLAYGYLPRTMTRQIRINVREHARERTVSRDISHDYDF